MRWWRRCGGLLQRTDLLPINIVHSRSWTVSWVSKTPPCIHSFFDSAIIQILEFYSTLRLTCKLRREIIAWWIRLWPNLSTRKSKLYFLILFIDIYIYFYLYIDLYIGNHNKHGIATFQLIIWFRKIGSINRLWNQDVACSKPAVSIQQVHRKTRCETTIFLFVIPIANNFGFGIDELDGLIGSRTKTWCA